MIRINLLSKNEKKNVQGLREVSIGALTVCALLTIILIVHLWQIKTKRDIDTRMAVVQKRISELEDVKRKVDEFKAKNKELEEKIKIINVLEENRTGPLYVMDALGDATPERLWVDKFSEKGYLAKIEGIAWDEFTVADLMKGLQSSPYYRNIELKSIKTKNIQTLSLRTFLIEARLNYSGKTEEKKPDTELQGKVKEVSQSERVK